MAPTTKSMLACIVIPVVLGPIAHMFGLPMGVVIGYVAGSWATAIPTLCSAALPSCNRHLRNWFIRRRHHQQPCSRRLLLPACVDYSDWTPSVS